MNFLSLFSKPQCPIQAGEALGQGWGITFVPSWAVAAKMHSHRKPPVIPTPPRMAPRLWRLSPGSALQLCWP